MMKVTWDTDSIPGMNATVEDSDVLTLVESLSRLGFTASVVMLDNPANS